MPWVRAPAIASEDKSHPLPDHATGLPILRPHPAAGCRFSASTCSFSDLTRSPMETTPTNSLPSITGNWPNRSSVSWQGLIRR